MILLDKIAEGACRGNQRPPKLSTLAAQGRKDAMRDTQASFRTFVLTEGTSAELAQVDALIWRLDSPEAPPRWMLDLPVQVAAEMWETPGLTACLTWLRRGRADKIKLARHTLARCKTLVAVRFAKRILVQVHLLEAWAEELVGAPAEALRCLEEAVARAAPGQAMRYFLDVDAALLLSLQELHDRGIEVAFLERMLAAAGAEAAGKQTNPQAVALLGQLSKREMEVLNLLAQRKANKEIAAELHISLRTVSIYRRMAVSGRRTAVARAVALGLVPNG